MTQQQQRRITDVANVIRTARTKGAWLGPMDDESFALLWRRLPTGMQCERLSAGRVIVARERQQTTGGAGA